jgi:hypothetical protein
MPAPDPALNAIGVLLVVSVLIPVAGWRHWFGRIRNRDFIAWADRPDKWLAAKSLYAKTTRKPDCLGLAIGCAVVH